MSFHVTMSSTLRGRDVQLFEVEYLGEAITSVAADVVRRLHEAGFKLKSVYLGGSKHWVAAKSMIGVHSMPLNNLDLKEFHVAAAELGGEDDAVGHVSVGAAASSCGAAARSGACGSGAQHCSAGWGLGAGRMPARWRNGAFALLF